MGWAVLERIVNNLPKIIDCGEINCLVKDFNVNNEPNRSLLYPVNIWQSAEDVKFKVFDLIIKFNPELLVIENTTKSRNRHTQRLLEWFNKSIFDLIVKNQYKFQYIDPSEWRKILNIRLSNEDKNNNKLVSKGIKKGRIGKKHISVRWVNYNFNKKFKLKDNNICDAIALGTAFLKG